jgi:hypothetical protein
MGRHGHCVVWGKPALEEEGIVFSKTTLFRLTRHCFVCSCSGLVSSQATSSLVTFVVALCLHMPLFHLWFYLPKTTAFRLSVPTNCFCDALRRHKAITKAAIRFWLCVSRCLWFRVSRTIWSCPCVSTSHLISPILALSLPYQTQAQPRGKEQSSTTEY